MALLLTPDQLIPQPSGLSSKIEATRYGAYYHRHLAVHLPRKTFDSRPEAVSSILKEEKNPEKRLDAAIRQVTILHEIRHFHDSFGTRAGISIFLNHVARLRAFVRVCEQLFAHGLIWKLPIQQWIGEKDCPEYVGEFVNELAFNTFRQMCFEGLLGPKSQNARDDRSWAEFSIKDLDLKFMAFPLRLDHALVDPSGVVDEGGATHWVPIGFNVLIEGNAQALQMEWLQNHFPRDIVERFKMAQEEHSFILANEEDVDLIELGKALVSPYRVTDLLITKFLRTKYPSISTFPRSRILELTDHALMSSKISAWPGKKYLGAGNMFVKVVEDGNWLNQSGRVVSDSSSNVDELQSYKEQMLSCPRPEETPDNMSLYSILDYVERFARHRIISSMLKLRIKYGNQIFSNSEEYMRHGDEFPLPPAVVIDGSIIHGRDDEPDFKDRWAKYMMLSGVAEHIWSGRRIIPCPRAYPQTALGLANCEFSAPSHDTLETLGCDRMIATRRCLTWDERRKAPLPNCYFENLTRGLRLARRSSRARNI